MSPEEQLAHEEQVAKILTIRHRDGPTHWWESAGVTAMLSAVAGAVIAFAGSYLLKDREMQKERVEARVERIRKAAFDANHALASMLKANEERYLLATGQLSELDSVQRVAIARGTNMIQQGWRLQRENAEMGLVLAFDADSTVDTTWTASRNALERLTTCMEAAYLKYLRQRAPMDICESERSINGSALRTFRSRLRHEYKVALAEFP
jgi:hypothetical protein